MKLTALVVMLTVLFIPAAHAEDWSIDWSPRIGDTAAKLPESRRDTTQDRYSTPRPATGPYDRPTLGDPRPVIYPKRETLGDPRTYRKTNPRTCTSLLCD